MLKLNKHLETQMNTFRGTYLDFIFKVNNVLEFNQLADNEFYDYACVKYDRQGGSATVNGGNGLRKQFELNNDLLYISFEMLHIIDEHDKHLHYHLTTVLKNIYNGITDKFILTDFRPEKKSKSEEV